MAPKKVDLIVGIDFGMTCSGVAFARPKMKSPKLIQKWPGTDGLGSSSNKVPSLLLYGNDGSLKQWGFSCQTHPRKKEWFKRLLDERVFASHHQQLSKTPDVEPPYATIEEVRKCYQDYMTCLYNHLSETIQKNDEWKDKRVEFIFSLPTTFTAPQITNSLRPLLENAGFEKGGRNHSIVFGLTEPQASAVYTAVDSEIEFKDGEILMVCDAGGGTTDLAILQKFGDDEDGTQLKEMLPVAGYNFGSTNIDESFCALVEKRLEGSGLEVKDNTAWTMVHRREFQNLKQKFGTIDERQFKELPVKVPGLNAKTSNGKAGITLGSMIFSHSDFHQMFDIEVDKMIRRIKNQMSLMSQKLPSKKINYLVLSGGLGSSAYVQKRLKEALTGANAHSAAPLLKVIAAENDEPQLAVVKGLVLDQMQRQNTGRAVLKGIKARASYGVVCDVLYDPVKDIGHTPYKDPFNGKLMLQGHIVWVIKKDHLINFDKAKKHEFTRIFSHDHPRKWKSTIVVCHTDADNLPSNAWDGDEEHADVKKLAEVESDLSKVNISRFTKQKGKREWLGIKKGEPYYEARYDVKFVVGAAADAKFELWFQGQQWTEQNAIKIDWQEGANLPAPVATPKKFHSTGTGRRQYECSSDDD